MGKPSRRLIACILCTVSAFLVLGALSPRAAGAYGNPLQSLSCGQIPGTYLVSREPTSGPSRILTIFKDGNLSTILSIQQVQFGVDNGFSDAQGAWKCTGRQKIQAHVQDLCKLLDSRLRGNDVMPVKTGIQKGGVGCPL